VTWCVLIAACGTSSDPTTKAPEPATAPVACDGDDLGPTTFLVPPYVQDVTPTSARILWETTTDGIGSRVELGPDEALGQVACGALVPLVLGAEALTEVHDVLLDGLEPATRYSYRARTGETTSPILAFRTAAHPDAEAAVRLVAMGDSQMDTSHPDKLREVVEEGVIPWATSTWDPDLSAAIDLALLAGDLVDNGWAADDWTDEFFPQAGALLGQVPLYPVPGNHEGNSPLYFRYFHLPEAGAEESAEHWYTVDRSNLRVIGLDSNPPYDDPEQLAWLDGVLDGSCLDPTIDFVFAQLHHPFQSELWPEGESDWTGEVIARLEQFSTDCGKPSVHFFGHTHAYSRGQSRDHRHLWVNVSSAGGALDTWGSPPQPNYPEYTDSQDSWGFVAVEVTAGDDPALTLRRVSRGNDAAPSDNATTDQITVRRLGRAPSAPWSIGASSACDGPVVLDASPYVGDAPHGATHWQLAATCDGFDAPTVERWRQSNDWFGGVDLQAGDDLTDEVFPELGLDETTCWRARYRSEELEWSEWSPPAVLETPSLCP
jgi:acid phosphatase type 7